MLKVTQLSTVTIKADQLLNLTIQTFDCFFTTDGAQLCLNLTYSFTSPKFYFVQCDKSEPCSPNPV